MPGGDLVLAVIFRHQPNWHIHTNDPVVPPQLGDPSDYIKTQLLFEPEAGPVQAHPRFIQWPKPHEIQVRFTGDPVTYLVFDGEAIAYVPLTIAEDAPLGPTTLTVKPVFQVCDDTQCLAPTPQPGEGSRWDEYGIPIEIEIVSAESIEQDPPSAADPDIFGGYDDSVVADLKTSPSSSESDDSTQPSQSDATTVQQDETASFFGLRIPKASGLLGGLMLILLGIIGGFILNLTPCVLPVIPLKIMTLSQHAATPGRAMSLGLWMALGVFAFWLAIGLPVVLFASVTDPSRIFGIWWVTFGIGAIIGIMGIGIMGLFTLSLPQSAYMVNPKAENAWGSFLFGVMAAVLGLPCFGFIAGALFAGAATLPPFMTLMIFGSIGIGMGAPYLVLAAFPKLVERIPRTGPASDLVKQIMGLMLLAAAAYFIGSGLIGLVAENRGWPVCSTGGRSPCIDGCRRGLCLRTFQITSNPVQRLVWTVTADHHGVRTDLVFDRGNEQGAPNMDGPEQARIQSAGSFPDDRNPYDPITFEAAREEGKIVVVDFTAEWCINCKALKAAVLDQDPVKKRLAEDDDIVMFTADNTSRNACMGPHVRDSKPAFHCSRSGVRMIR